MKIWKLTESVYAIKERLGPETYKKVISIDGVNYSKKKWRIQFRGDRIDKIREVVDEVEIIKGYDLIEKLYRISKFKPRKGLMKHSVVIYEANEYIYFLLTDDNLEVLDEYEGAFVARDDEKVKQYAKEYIYLNKRERLLSYRPEKDWSMKNVVDVIEEEEGSILENDLDSTPLMFTHRYYDLELTSEERGELFKKEIKARRVNAFSVEMLAEKRGVEHGIWYPILEKLVEEEINMRRFKLEQLAKKEGVENLFSKERAIKLGVELDKLTEKINRPLDESLDKELVKEYLDEKERRMYGI